MKRGKVLVVALALLALLAGAAQGEMFVEGYLGGNFAANASPTPGYTTGNPLWTIFHGTYPGHIDPAFLGGVKLGAWFERSGVLSGVNFPAWMKYFGFWMDFCYHRLNFANRGSTMTGIGPAFDFHPIHVYSEGGAATLAFMFAARYGFFPDKDVPFGRLQPYVAVGPAIMWTWQQPTFLVDGSTWNNKFDSESKTNLALAVEAGLRWMCLKNVSLDLSFKYRYARPSYDYRIPWGFGFNYIGYRLDPTYHLFSFQLGAAYHF